MNKMPKLFIIAGCNGAGKTTASYSILPEILNCREFVNADEIAKGLSPFQPETVAIQAGRIMLQRIQFLLDSKADFGFETTLATRSYLQLIKRAKSKGYEVSLLFFWLESPEMAVQRVRERVMKGGHNIPQETIIRRYWAGIENFNTIFAPEVDEWILIQNSNPTPEIIAEKRLYTEIQVLQPELYKHIQDGKSKN
jgi:predicted ABC-type ATPase